MGQKNCREVDSFVACLRVARSSEHLNAALAECVSCESPAFAAASSFCRVAQGRGTTPARGANGHCVRSSSTS
eukprot:6179536-Pleurochrysis_carterae.AAC.3